jgi:hypothetical protein
MATIPTPAGNIPVAWRFGKVPSKKQEGLAQTQSDSAFALQKDRSEQSDSPPPPYQATGQGARARHSHWYHDAFILVYILSLYRLTIELIATAQLLSGSNYDRQTWFILETVALVSWLVASLFYSAGGIHYAPYGKYISTGFGYLLFCLLHAFLATMMAHYMRNETPSRWSVFLSFAGPQALCFEVPLFLISWSWYSF